MLLRAMPSRAFEFAVNAHTIALPWAEYCAVIECSPAYLSANDKASYYRRRRDFIDEFLGRPGYRYIKRMKLKSARPIIIRNLLCDRLRCTEAMNHFRYGTPKPRV